MQIGYGRCQRVIDRGGVHNFQRKRGRSARRFVRPTVARRDKPQVAQAKICHRPGGSADVLAKLRLDEDDCGAFRRWHFVFLHGAFSFL